MKPIEEHELNEVRGGYSREQLIDLLERFMREQNYTYPEFNTLAR